MNTVCDIAQPAQQIETDNGPVTIWPWFDLQGQNAKIDQLWAAYRDTRIRTDIPNGWPMQDDAKQIYERYGSKNMMMLLMVAEKSGEYTKGNHRRMAWNNIEETKKYKLFAQALHALHDALTRQS